MLRCSMQKSQERSPDDASDNASLPLPTTESIPGIDAPHIGATSMSNHVDGTFDMSTPHLFNSQQGMISIASQTGGK